MTKTYGATNPQQIIDLFEMRAQIADNASKRATTKKEQRNGFVEMVTWRAAADILRNTEFVGWNTGTRPVEEYKPGKTTVIEHRKELVQQTPADKNALREQLMRNQREACPCGYSIGRCNELGPDCPNRAKY